MASTAKGRDDVDALSLWTTAPGEMALRSEALPDVAAGEVRLRALYSGVSRGTEALVMAGRVPEALHETMRCPRQDGTFPFPVKYGYALVGIVEAGPAHLVGRTCFALHPHQDLALLPEEAVLPLPEGLPPKRAALAANMETALNIAWDSGAGAGDRVLVVGAGVVGLLTASLLAAIPATEVTIVDRNPARREVADRLGLALAAPDAAPQDVDVAVNLSGSAAGLQCAIDAAGREAIVVEASWYGDAPATLSLGGAFHPRRLTIRSSQVGDLPAGHKARWTFARRLATALDLLATRPGLDALISHEIPFREAPARLPPLLAPGADALCAVLSYSEPGDR